MSLESEELPPGQPAQPVKNSPVKWMWILFGAMVVCGCVMIPVAIALFLPVFLQARNSAQRSSCMANLKSLGVAEGLYVEDYNDRLMTQAWMDGLIPYSKHEKLFHCPAADQGRLIRYGYSMNTDAIGKAVSEFPDITKAIIVFDSTPNGRNSVSDLASLPEPPRHTKNLVLFLDGRVHTYP